MQITIENPQKARLETIDIEFTDENTTWFDDEENTDGIYKVTDFEGGLLISEISYSYPILIYDLSRKDIGYDKHKADELKRRYE
jgi:hypothetical protein